MRANLVIVSAAFCPQPPLLIDGVGGEASGELDLLRGACDRALRTSLAVADEVVIIGGAEHTAWFVDGSVGSLSSFGVRRNVTLGFAESAAVPTLPLSLTIGAWLLARQEFVGSVSAVSIATNYPISACIEMGEQIARETSKHTALLVLGDGSARRGPKAPGYIDSRAHAFDTAIGEALGAGMPKELLELSGALAGELLVAGRSSWQVAAAAIGSAATVNSELLFSDDPYGVMYFVAQWLGNNPNPSAVTENWHAK